MKIGKRLLNEVEVFVKSMQDFAGQIDNIIDESVEETFDIAAFELDERFAACIDSFYNSYEPGSKTKSKRPYQRQYSLYNAYKIKRSKLSLSWDWDAQYMNDFHHRVSNEYIFDITFNLGYHGGANKGENPDHPMPGVYLWRTGRFFTDWMTSPVVPKTMPIDFRQQQVINNYKKEKRLQQIFDKSFPSVFMNYYKKSDMYKIINKWK